MFTEQFDWSAPQDMNSIWGPVVAKTEDVTRTGRRVGDKTAGHVHASRRKVNVSAEVDAVHPPPTPHWKSH
jgi:hypothetical protein